MSKQAKNHTPGKRWHWGFTGGGEPKRHGQYLYNQAGERLLSREAACGLVDGDLIAAAPDLLEALEELVNATAKETTSDGGMMEDEYDYETARAAIARAKGVTP
jgi:hypothetical protein